MAEFATLEALAGELVDMGTCTPEYWAKQVHKVPASSVVDRIDYLKKLATGKSVLHIGCTGALDVVLREVATPCYGIDNQPLARPDFTQCNLDDLATNHLPFYAGVELIVCGEVLEHLANPGYFLNAIRKTYPSVPLVLTVPNAFCAAGASWLTTRGRENVHKDHVCYYTYTTLSTLLRRYGYTVTTHLWYNGKPYTAEGLIVLARQTP